MNKNIKNGTAKPNQLAILMKYAESFPSIYRNFCIYLDMDKDADVINLLDTSNKKELISKLVLANKGKKVTYPVSNSRPHVSACRFYAFKFRKDIDKDVIDELDRQSSITNYIVALIRNNQSLEMMED